MMMNLFSSFDPSSNFNFSLNWLSSSIFILLIPLFYWLIPSRIMILFQKILYTLHLEFKILLGLKSKGLTLIFINLLILILINNFMGLFPYIFTATSHMSISLSLAFPLWLSFLLFGWINNMNHMFAHLVPQGTPSLLMSFMVCIETISNLIRPLTLAIRLSANMIAGHLLLTLLGNTGNILISYLIPLLLIIQILLLTLEFAVSIIQSYVFAILMTLYSSEVL
uniref:ATP synthase subunit a n=1 Tax=Aderidae sp. GENSP01 TaxID=1205532 RepID=A0A0S2MP91_9CUCU|nr:ATP synthase F0 subunit 6 [Aderidae sp. GENSP01]